MIYDVALTLIERIGVRTSSALVDALGSAKIILRAPREQLIEVGISESVATHLIKGREHALRKAEETIELCRRTGVSILPQNSNHYPNLLRQCADAPQVLYVRGYVNFNAGKWISIVGTRKATQNGLALTAAMVGDISCAFPDAVIVSGLAFGIDKTAHESAMSHNLKTVAVMAGWVDEIVPRSHYGVARKILSQDGAIISDMPPGTVIRGSNFLSRNRIIAGISDATIVAESSARGGSLVTADIALSYDREVFAIPGRVDDNEYQGTNALIRSNKATLYQDVSDIAQTMGWTRATFQGKNPSELPDYLLETFSIMPDTEPFTLDFLCEKLGIYVSEASSRVIQLEVQGFVKSIQGRMYQKAKY